MSNRPNPELAGIDLLAMLREIEAEQAADPVGTAARAAANDAAYYASLVRANPRAAHPCRRCGGSGHLSAYYYVQGGTCFRCGGNGVDPGYSPDSLCDG